MSKLKEANSKIQVTSQIKELEKTTNITKEEVVEIIEVVNVMTSIKVENKSEAINTIQSMVEEVNKTIKEEVDISIEVVSEKV